MRGPSRKVQNLIKIRLYPSTVQGEVLIKSCTKNLKNQNQTLSMLSTSFELQTESQISRITLSGVPLKVIIQEAKRRSRNE